METELGSGILHLLKSGLKLTLHDLLVAMITLSGACMQSDCSMLTAGSSCRQFGGMPDEFPGWPALLFNSLSRGLSLSLPDVHGGWAAGCRCRKSALQRRRHEAHAASIRSVDLLVAGIVRGLLTTWLLPVCGLCVYCRRAAHDNCVRLRQAVSCKATAFPGYGLTACAHGCRCRTLTTAGDQTRLLALLADGAFGSPAVSSAACATLGCSRERCRYAVRIMTWQKIKHRLPSLLPEGTTVAHKTGYAVS